MPGLSFLAALLLWPPFWPLSAPAQDVRSLDAVRLDARDILRLQSASASSVDDAGVVPPCHGARGRPPAPGDDRSLHSPLVIVDGNAVPGRSWRSLRAELGGATKAVMIRPLSTPDLSTLPGRPQPPPKVVPPMAPATALVGAGTGFHVSGDRIVTAAGVVQDYRGTWVEDGSEPPGSDRIPDTMAMPTRDRP